MSKKRITITRTSKVLGTIFQIVLILILVAVAVMGFSSRIPFLAERGLRFYAVTSGSMEPTIPVGSVIYVSNVADDSISEGDVITYFTKNPDENDAPAIVTHRVTKVVKEDSSETLVDQETGEEREQVYRRHEFVTKGDANATEDIRMVPVSNVIGVYQWHVPYMGHITTFAQNPRGFFLLVIIPGTILIVSEVFSIMQHLRGKSEEETKAELDKVKKELEKVKAEKASK